VFEEIFNIPAHPLIVHGAVVFVPLQIMAAFAYALVPFVRRYTAWAVVGLAVLAPAAAYAAKLSGQALRDRLIRNGTSDAGILAKITQHSQYADRTLFASIVLSLLMLALVFVPVILSRRRSNPGGDKSEGDKSATAPTGRGSAVFAVLLIVAVLGVGATTGYFIFKTGDSGAHIVWEGI